MDKKAIIKQLEAQIVADLVVLTKAAVGAREAAVHAESKAEDQYDTRGLEASYLAEAQSKRAMELEGLLALYRNVDLMNFGAETPISATALVVLVCEDKSFYYLLMPKGGGMNTSFSGKLIQVITPQSPLGEALLGQKSGNEISVFLAGKSRDYLIESVQ